jgi:sugar O-acyltransferase (sialic acid O-acetyltransferase NeuD family)
MDRMIVIGGGGHAKVIIGALLRLPWDVTGYTDLRDGGPILGVPYVGDDSALPGLLRAYGRCSSIVGLGKTDTSASRTRVREKVEALGFEFPVVVSPHALVNEQVTIGSGTAVLDGVVVNSGTAIGRECIINTNSTVEHDCLLEDNVHVASGATVSGGVTIGSNCMIGAGATIVQAVRICPDCLVGAGAVVVRHIETPGTYVGVPAERAG